MASYCAKCGSKATLTCNMCQDCPTSDLASKVAVGYCTRACQISDASKHAKDCRAARYRLSLQVITEVVQDLVVIYRIAMLDLPVVQVDHERGRLIIHTSSTGVKTTCPTGFTIHTSEQLWASAGHLGQSAILSYLASAECVAFTSGLLASQLCQIAIEINAVEMKLKSPPIVTHVIHEQKVALHSSKTQNHFVIRIKLKSDEMFAMDVAGGHHGLLTTLTPWDTYIANHCYRVVREHDMATIRKEFHAHRQPSMSTLMMGRAKMTIQFIEMQHLEKIIMQQPCPTEGIDKPGYAKKLREWADDYREQMMVIIGICATKVDSLAGLTPAQKPKKLQELHLWRVLRGEEDPNSLRFAIVER